MKLSEAMRKGIAITKPYEGELLMPCIDGVPYACALGAALVGVKGPELADTLGTDGEGYEMLEELWPEMREFVAHPEHGFERDLMSTIYSLNDSYHWERERIANWLEQSGY